MRPKRLSIPRLFHSCQRSLAQSGYSSPLQRQPPFLHNMPTFRNNMDTGNKISRASSVGHALRFLDKCLAKLRHHISLSTKLPAVAGWPRFQVISLSFIKEWKWKCVGRARLYWALITFFFFLPLPNGFSIMDKVAQATVYGRGKGLRDTLR